MTGVVWLLAGVVLAAVAQTVAPSLFRSAVARFRERGALSGEWCTECAVSGGRYAESLPRRQAWELWDVTEHPDQGGYSGVAAYYCRQHAPEGATRMRA